MTHFIEHPGIHPSWGNWVKDTLYFAHPREGWNNGVPVHFRHPYFSTRPGSLICGTFFNGGHGWGLRVVHHTAVTMTRYYLKRYAGSVINVSVEDFMQEFE